MGGWLSFSINVLRFVILLRFKLEKITEHMLMGIILQMGKNSEIGEREANCWGNVFRRGFGVECPSGRVGLDRRMNSSGMVQEGRQNIWAQMQ